jgi:hypothetical protein
MRRTILAIALCALAACAGCGIDKPWLPDGRASLVIMVADTSGIVPGGVKGVPFFLDSTEVRLQARNQQFLTSKITSADGIADFDHLDTGTYAVFARREMLIDNNKKLFTGSFDIAVSGNQTKADTVIVKLIAASQLMVNEINYCGSCASTFYFYDQYVELYNSSADTMYLDGMIVTRQLGTIDPEMEIKDYTRAIYAFQFPGTPLTGRQHPIMPGQFAVIATDAIDHRPYCPSAQDLSHADWEMFNALGNDYDNLNVPNLNNIMPNRTTDYLINLVHNAVVLANGAEYNVDADGYLRIPVKDVVDGVEWSSNPASAKELTVRIDAGFAGIGITRYSGYSTERRELGLDTNDSSFDFMNLVHPTPGRFH